MLKPPHHSLLLQIVIGSAWADHELQPAERAYLDTLLERYGEARNPEFRTLLEKPVLASQTERWMRQYLQGATEEDRQRLLGAIGNLLFADEQVTEEEHQLLDEYHNLMAAIPPRSEPPAVVKAVGRWLSKVISQKKA